MGEQILVEALRAVERKYGRGKEYNRALLKLYDGGYSLELRVEMAEKMINGKFKF